MRSYNAILSRCRENIALQCFEEVNNKLGFFSDIPEVQRDITLQCFEEVKKKTGGFF